MGQAQSGNREVSTGESRARMVDEVITTHKALGVPTILDKIRPAHKQRFSDPFDGDWYSLYVWNVLTRDLREGSLNSESLFGKDEPVLEELGKKIEDIFAGAGRATANPASNLPIGLFASGILSSILTPETSSASKPRCEKRPAEDVLEGGPESSKPRID